MYIYIYHFHFLTILLYNFRHPPVELYVYILPVLANTQNRKILIKIYLIAVDNRHHSFFYYRFIFFTFKLNIFFSISIFVY